MQARNRVLSILSILLVLSFVLSACGTPAPAPATVAPAAPTAAPAEPTKAPEPTAAPAEPTKAPEPTAAPEATKAPEPTAAPESQYKEAPMLAELVAAGTLPALEERLPKTPYVIEAPEVGQYGGAWRRGFLGPSDRNGLVRIMNDGLVRFSTDGATVEMKYAESVVPNDDYTEWTINLREGGKWSDGEPFTADDILFYYNDVALNKDISPSVPSWLLNKDGSTVKVEKDGDYAVKFTFAAPQTLFLQEIAQQDAGDKKYPMFLPAHYLKEFHASYADKAELDKMVAEAGVKTWGELFYLKQDQYDNPDRPVLAAWKATNRFSEQVFILERNPYYMGVDQDGQQLPYMDEVQVKFFADADALNLAAIAGELDQQERHVKLANYPVLKEEQQKSGKYNVYLWSSTGGEEAGVIFNLTYAKDPELTEMWSNLEFRKAVSHAIDRAEIQESIFLGTGEPRHGIIKPGHPWYPGDEVAQMYTEFDPDLANEILDGLGYTERDGEGYRLLPSGKRVGFELSAVPALGAYVPVAELIVADLKEVGIWVDLQVRERDLHFQMRQANELMAEVWNQDSAGTMFSGSTKFDLRPGIYGNLTYGPLFKTWYDTNGKEGVEPPAPWKRIVELQDEARTVGPERQAEIAQEIFTLWVENLYDIGTVGLTATDQGVVVVNKDLRNVPENLTKDWALRTPGNGKPEIWFFAR
jgi:peptide/nickel transport system substrate-binding protein